MGQKSMQKKSFDEQKLNSFYNPNLSQSKLDSIQKMTNKRRIKYVGRAFVFGFILEYGLGVSKIYQNNNIKSAQRRLNAKRKEDLAIQQSIQKKQMMKPIISNANNKNLIASSISPINPVGNK